LPFYCLFYYLKVVWIFKNLSVKIIPINARLCNPPLLKLIGVKQGEGERFVKVGVFVNFIVITTVNFK